MPLDRDLTGKTMRFSCPHCGAEMERPGSTVMAAKQVRCLGCGQSFKIGYDEKQRLFQAARDTLPPTENAD